MKKREKQIFPKQKKPSKKFEKIIHQIKEVKIQGATEIAKAGIKAYLIQSDENSIKRILNSRPTEPLLQNSIQILQKAKDKKKTATKLLASIKKSQQKIAKTAKQLIRNNINIYSHCHSSTVIEILKYAKKKKKKFVVYTSEVEPLLQGRKTAEDLARSKIQVVVVPDLAAEQVLKKCDLLLFGSDAYLPRAVVNKIGTSILCQIAKRHNIPRFTCGTYLKFTKKIKIESRNSDEVWKKRNKFIDIQNPAFDKFSSKILTGIISEFGITNYRSFIKKAKKKINSL